MDHSLGLGEIGQDPGRSSRQGWELGSLLGLPQEIPLRSNVYEVYATDKDEGLNGAVRYSFLKTAGSRDWEYFTIDAVSGLIQTAQRLDREKQAVYNVRRRGPRGTPFSGPRPPLCRHPDCFWGTRAPGRELVWSPKPSPSYSHHAPPLPAHLGGQ